MYNCKTIMCLYVGVLGLFSCKTGIKEKESRVERLPYYEEATFTPKWLSYEEVESQDFHRVSEFQLINQEGDTITKNTFEGKIYVTDFFFSYCPGICPKMTYNMSILQKEFLNDEEVLLLSHTVTPGHDSVETLKRYAQKHDINSEKWHLVTGDRDLIYELGRQDYFIEEDLGLGKKADEFIHTENFVLVDKNGRLRGIYNGLNKTSIQQLIADIKTLKKERS